MASSAPNLLNGRYRFGDLLGEGATATVSRAFDVLLHRDVAIKMLKPAFAHDAVVVERFYSEARAAAGLVHPHVVGVYDVFSEGPLHALVMEYVDGPSLAQLVVREVRLDERRAIRYARQVAQALTAAHAHGILHRDVKPANVLIAPDDTVRVTDFGLAKAFTAGDPALTEPGRLVGSTHYFSPEQAQGSALSPASDLYSLGVVLYQMVTGSLPFTGDSPVAIAVAHVTTPPPPEAELVRRMSPGLAAIVHRLLQKDPADRYSTAAELDGELAALQLAPEPDAAWAMPTMVGTMPVVTPLRRKKRDAFARGTQTVALRVRPALAALAATMVVFAERSLARAAERFDPMRRRAVRQFAAVPTATKAMAGAAITLIVFLGALTLQPHTVAVADLRHQPATQARATLTSLGFTPVIVTKADNAAAGTVIAQEPRPGTRLQRGESVRLTVSSGLPMVTVPNLLGADLGTAVRAMRRSHLATKYAARIADAPPNVVIEQYPVAGTRVRVKSPALVVISAGPQPRIVPSYSQDGGDGG